MDMRCPGACCEDKAVTGKCDFSWRGDWSREASYADTFERTRGGTRNRERVSWMVKSHAAGEAGLEEELTEAEGVNLRSAVSTTDHVQPSFPF